MFKILLLEDDLVLLEIMSEFLENEGYFVTPLDNGIDAMDMLQDEKFDILILDINVPNISGIDILKDIRENKITIPAIFITSLNTPDDVVKGFKAGCNDYLKKPFDLDELKARIDNLINIFGLKNDLVTLCDGVIFDKESLKIKNKTNDVSITKKEALILDYLLKNKHKIVSMDELINNVYSYYDSPNESTIRTYIKNLRKAIGKECITNIKGVGYKINSI